MSHVCTADSHDSLSYSLLQRLNALPSDTSRATCHSHRGICAQCQRADVDHRRQEGEQGETYCWRYRLNVYPEICDAARSNCSARRKCRSFTRGLDVLPRDMYASAVYHDTTHELSIDRRVGEQARGRLTVASKSPLNTLCALAACTARSRYSVAGCRNPRAST